MGYTLKFTFDVKKTVMLFAVAFAATAVFADAYVVVHPMKNGAHDPIGKAINDVRFCLEIVGCKYTAADYPKVDEGLLRDTKVLFLHSGLAPKGKAKDAIDAYEKRGGKVYRYSRWHSFTRKSDGLYTAMKELCPGDAAYWDGLKAENDKRVAAEVAEAKRKPGKKGEIRRLSFHDTPWRPIVHGEEWSWDRAVKFLAERGWNELAMSASAPNMVNYRSKVCPFREAEVAAKGDMLDEFVAACHKYGVKAVCGRRCFRVKVYNCDTKHRDFTDEFRKWLNEDGRGMRTKDGKATDSLCPADPLTRANEVASVLELAERGADAIALDFIRFSGVHVCYCDRCRKGIAGHNGDIGAWKCETITSLVREMRRKLKEKYPKVQLNACLQINPTTYGKTGTGQVWDEWCEEGLIDEVYAMDYSNRTEDFEERVKRHSTYVRGQKLVPLFGPILWPRHGHDVKCAVEQIEVTRKYADGFAVFAFGDRVMDLFDQIGNMMKDE